MAKVHAPFKISGKIGDFTFYNSGGHNYIRQAPWHKKFTDAYYQEHRTQFQNRYRFAGAVVAARQVRLPLAGDYLAVMRPQVHNLIRGRFRATQNLAPDTWIYDFLIAHFALHQLDLAPDDGPSSMLVTRLIGPRHQPTHIHLDHLNAIANHIRNKTGTHGNAELQMRIKLNWMNFVTVTFNASNKKWNMASKSERIKLDHSSRWIPAKLLPEDGITIAARPKEGLPEDEAIFLCLLIEWREYRPVGEQYTPLDKQGTARFLTCQCSPEQLEEIDRVTKNEAAKAAEATGPEEAVSDLNEGLSDLM